LDIRRIVVKNYQVEIDFKGDYSFQATVAANDPTHAKAKALEQAKSAGWNKPATKYKVREA
jgi:hypothetical protein